MVFNKYYGQGCFTSDKYSFIGIYEDHEKSGVGLLLKGDSIYVCNWDKGKRLGPGKRMSQAKTKFYFFTDNRKKPISEEDFNISTRKYDRKAKVLFALDFESALNLFNNA